MQPPALPPDCATLLAWTSEDAPRSPSRVEVRELPGRGRGLVATADLAPGQVVLSVPFPSRVFASWAEAAADPASTGLLESWRADNFT